jgi:hypothetical protein
VRLSTEGDRLIGKELLLRDVFPTQPTITVGAARVAAAA